MVGPLGVLLDRDLGMQVHSTREVVAQIDKVVKKLVDTFAFIDQGIEYRNWDDMLQLYKTRKNAKMDSGFATEAAGFEL